MRKEVKVKMKKKKWKEVKLVKMKKKRKKVKMAKMKKKPKNKRKNIMRRKKFKMRSKMQIKNSENVAMKIELDRDEAEEEETEELVPSVNIRVSEESLLINTIVDKDNALASDLFHILEEKDEIDIVFENHYRTKSSVAYMIQVMVLPNFNVELLEKKLCIWAGKPISKTIPDVATGAAVFTLFASSLHHGHRDHAVVVIPARCLYDVLGVVVTPPRSSSFMASPKRLPIFSLFLSGPATGGVVRVYTPRRARTSKPWLGVFDPFQLVVVLRDHSNNS
ncbi:hypothetical protein Sjap_015379 [Stephania japonica]|uniref:Uncharacterized protein n=1 Tax=Stephania japonica TaxID=461633 RepID=A0AAP0IKX4_9MAGN